MPLCSKSEPPPAQNPSNLKIRPLDLLQNWSRSRTFKSHQMQQSKFKLDVGSSLIGDDIFDKIFRKFNLQIMTILEVSTLVEAFPIKSKVGATIWNKIVARSSSQS